MWEAGGKRPSSRVQLKVAIKPIQKSDTDGHDCLCYGNPGGGRCNQNNKRTHEFVRTGAGSDAGGSGRSWGELVVAGHLAADPGEVRSRRSGFVDEFPSAHHEDAVG